MRLGRVRKWGEVGLGCCEFVPEGHSFCRMLPPIYGLPPLLLSFTVCMFVNTKGWGTDGICPVECKVYGLSVHPKRRCFQWRNWTSSWRLPVLASLTLSFSSLFSSFVFDRCLSKIDENDGFSSKLTSGKRRSGGSFSTGVRQGLCWSFECVRWLGLQDAEADD